jgi:hypothetical protein
MVLWEEVEKALELALSLVVFLDRQFLNEAGIKNLSPFGLAHLL